MVLIVFNGVNRFNGVNCFNIFFIPSYSFLIPFLFLLILFLFLVVNRFNGVNCFNIC